MISVGRRNAMKNVPVGAILLALVLALPAIGQEASSTPAYLFMIEASIAGEDSGDWADAVTLMSKSHAKHPDGNMWATYRKLTGGPDETVRTFFALSQMADLDAWPNNREILTEVLGKDQARVVLADLELSSSSTERILSYSEKLSHPKHQFRATPYVWIIEIKVEDGKMTEYAALAKRLAEFQKEKLAGTWMVYGNALGGDRSILHYFYGFDKFAEIDGWPSRLEVASESMGASEAAKLLAALEAVSETTTSLWQLEPELSQLDAE